MERINISTGSSWEPIVGYSRAVRIGHTIEVSGTTSADAEGIKFPGDLYSQARYCIEKILKALASCGAGKEHVIRTRMYVTDISKWEVVAKAHAEFFSEIRPATTMVEVSRLIDPALLVEIEASAVVG